MVINPGVKKYMDEQRRKRARGLYNKFRITRLDGKSRKGKRHNDCRYFVLDLNHDPYAKPAVRAYASACAYEYPQLAADLFEWLSQ